MAATTTPRSTSPRRRRGADSIAKNAVSTFASQMTTASLTAVLTLFLVRGLGARQYGLFALTIGMSQIAMALADFGISDSTSRFVAEHRGRDHGLAALVVDALKLKVVATGLFCALFAALASVIAGVYGSPELAWPLRGIALATFGQSTYAMLLGVSNSLGRAAINVRLVLVESLAEVSASVGLVLIGAGAAGATFGRAIGYGVGAAIAAQVVLRLSGYRRGTFWRPPDRATLRRVSGYAGPMFAIDVSYTVSASLSVLLLGAYVGSAASGVFQAPWKLITLIQYVGLATAYGVGPRLTRGPGQEPNVKALNAAIRALIGFQCLILAPAIVWSGPITRLLLGAGYGRSAGVLAALAPYVFFSGLAPLVTAAVSYAGEAGRRIPVSLATLALVAVGGVILIPRYGAVGAAIATDIAFGFYTLAHIWLCRRLLALRIRMLAWSLASGLTAAAAMGIVLDTVGTRHLSLLDWVIGGAEGLTAYATVMVLTREIRRVHIVRASALVDGLFRRSKPPGRPPTPPPKVPPQPRDGNVVARGLRNRMATMNPRPRPRGSDPSSPGLPPASQPPPWLSSRLSAVRAEEGGPGATTVKRHRNDEAAVQSEAISISDQDVVYEIVWRLDDTRGVFELRTRSSEVRDGLASEQSRSIAWGSRREPSPTREARGAHAALVDRLLDAGWRRAGTGETWFALRFRSPKSRRTGEDPHSRS